MKAKTSKQQAILDYLAKSPRSTPVEVAKALKSLGVTASYVSNVKSLHMRSKTPAPKKQHTMRWAVVQPVPNTNGTTPASGASPVYASKLAVDIVLQTRELANRCGGTSELRKLLDAMEA